MLRASSSQNHHSSYILAPELSASSGAREDGNLGSEQHPSRVLICEDQKDTAESLAALLRLQGYEVLVCHDGHSAMDRATAWRPTAAIIDIGLPGVTGYAVAQHIRELQFGGDVVLIAVTGYSTPADIQMARYAGFNWHFAKPADPSFLMDVLEDPTLAPHGRLGAVPLTPAH
jgi:CheY-like chemotaxis protein